MTRAVAGTIVGAVLAAVSPAAAGGPRERIELAERPLVVAQVDAFEEKKQAYLIDVGQEIGALSSHVAKLSQIYPTDGGANAAFAEAKRAFDEKMAVLQEKLAALRATPGASAQSAMMDADAALADLRNAYSGVTAAAR